MATDTAADAFVVRCLTARDHDDLLVGLVGQVGWIREVEGGQVRRIGQMKCLGYNRRIWQGKAVRSDESRDVTEEIVVQTTTETHKRIP
jgi:hypothetical protein